MELELIQNKIYEIRNCRVMLDFDLAEMYQVETRRLKEQVKRNIERFPADFMFQLSSSEWDKLIAICDKFPENIKHTPIIPSVFTQEGVAMLSGILRSPIAIQVNIGIMRAFVAARNYINQQSSISREIEDLWRVVNDLSEENRKELDDIYLAIAELASNQNQEKLKPNEQRKPIGYQHYNRSEP